jgi:transcriptional regulator with XRE-family HTH domain
LDVRYPERPDNGPMTRKSTPYAIECGKRLSATREALGYATVREFAKITGVLEARLWSWEAGKNLVSPMYVSELRRLFKVTHDWIFEGDPSGLPQALFILSRRTA